MDWPVAAVLIVALLVWLGERALDSRAREREPAIGFHAPFIRSGSDDE